jgi:hypothetical protein
MLQVNSRPNKLVSSLNARIRKIEIVIEKKKKKEKKRNK